MRTSKKINLIGIFFFILYLLCSCALLLAKLPNNGLLKKRVAERQAHQKANSLLEKAHYNSMQELAHSLEGINKLFELLGVSSIEEALKQIKLMQKDLNTLLNALEVESVAAGVDQAKKVRSVVEQLSQLQIKIAQS